MMKVLMKSPNDEVKLSKVETNIVDTKHVVLLTQLGIVLYRWWFCWWWSGRQTACVMIVTSGLSCALKSMLMSVTVIPSPSSSSTSPTSSARSLSRKSPKSRWRGGWKCDTRSNEIFHKQILTTKLVSQIGSPDSGLRVSQLRRESPNTEEWLTSKAQRGLTVCSSVKCQCIVELSGKFIFSCFCNFTALVTYLVRLSVVLVVWKILLRFGLTVLKHWKVSRMSRSAWKRCGCLWAQSCWCPFDATFCQSTRNTRFALFTWIDIFQLFHTCLSSPASPDPLVGGALTELRAKPCLHLGPTLPPSYHLPS